MFNCSNVQMFKVRFQPSVYSRRAFQSRSTKVGRYMHIPPALVHHRGGGALCLPPFPRPSSSTWWSPSRQGRVRPRLRRTLARGRLAGRFRRSSPGVSPVVGGAALEMGAANTAPLKAARTASVRREENCMAAVGDVDWSLVGLGLGLGLGLGQVGWAVLPLSCQDQRGRGDLYIYKKSLE